MSCANLHLIPSSIWSVKVLNRTGPNTEPLTPWVTRRFLRLLYLVWERCFVSASRQVSLSQFLSPSECVVSLECPSFFYFILLSAWRSFLWRLLESITCPFLSVNTFSPPLKLSLSRCESDLTTVVAVHVWQINKDGERGSEDEPGWLMILWKMY